MDSEEGGPAVAAAAVVADDEVDAVLCTVPATSSCEGRNRLRACGQSTSVGVMIILYGRTQGRDQSGTPDISFLGSVLWYHV